MRTFSLVQEFGEGIQIDPLWLVPAAFAYWAGDVASVFVTLAVLGFFDGHVGFAIAVLALDKDLNFNHHWLLSGALNKKSRPRLVALSPRRVDRPCLMTRGIWLHGSLMLAP